MSPRTIVCESRATSSRMEPADRAAPSPGDRASPRDPELAMTTASSPSTSTIARRSNWNTPLSSRRKRSNASSCSRARRRGRAETRLTASSWSALRPSWSRSCSASAARSSRPRPLAGGAGEPAHDQAHEHVEAERERDRVEVEVAVVAVGPQRLAPGEERGKEQRHDDASRDAEPDGSLDDRQEKHLADRRVRLPGVEDDEEGGDDGDVEGQRADAQHALASRRERRAGRSAR